MKSRYSVGVGVFLPGLMLLGNALPARAIDAAKVVMPPDCQLAFLGDSPRTVKTRCGRLLPNADAGPRTFLLAGFAKFSIFGQFSVDFENNAATLVRYEDEFREAEMRSKIGKFLDYVLGNYGPPDLLTINRMRNEAKPELVWSAPDRRIRASYTPKRVKMGVGSLSYWGGQYTLAINLSGLPKMVPGRKPAPLTRQEAITMLAETEAEINQHSAVQKKYPVEIPDGVY